MKDSESLKMKLGFACSSDKGVPDAYSKDIKVIISGVLGEDMVKHLRI